MIEVKKWDRNNSHQNISKILESTLCTTERGYYMKNRKRIYLPLSKEQMQASCVYLPMDVYDNMDLYKLKRKNQEGKWCKIYTKNMDTLEAAEKMHKAYPNKKTIVLSFCNPIEQGGGVRRGAVAQEESIALRTSLLLSLENETSNQFYDVNKNAKPIFAATDSCILSEVVVFKDKHYTYLDEPYVVSVISSAPPFVSPCSHLLEGYSQVDMEKLLYQRIAGIITTLIVNGYRNMVLGAWGCGCFGNDARIIAKIFSQIFKRINVDLYFDEICFAILTKGDNTYNLDAFKHYFPE